MSHWWGDLNLAYKYTIVFLSLLALTILAGLVKVYFDRRKLKKVTQKIKEEEEAREDQVELNQREKDEGDLFGVRAIEAGFFAGIPQSRPTSRAGSIAGSPSMSSTTLLGGLSSPKVQSMASSVTDLPLAHTNNRDSDVLPSHPPAPKRTPSNLKLEPSEAELTGRHNLNSAVNMGLAVPPSPVLTKAPRAPASDDADDVEREGRTSPLSGARSAVLTPPPGDVPHSQAASLVTDSPNSSRAASPGPYKATKPGHRSSFISYIPTMPSEASTSSEPTIVLPPTTGESTHQRETSDASSMYSYKRNSKHLSVGASKEANRQSATNNSLLAPNSASDAHRDPNDPRFSEFYDAYFRNSIIRDPTKKSDRLSLTPAIVEESSPVHAQ
ncbi:unnamed protein product [Periconia digitata]|uniref:Uncharacterized protein n=1 Tax=Periconia digitata TaxID=1303443 RepID=A0A9W4XQU6_9PLEO|nr:unnamed protein product [Periconia digitata]